jgi:hypothetical protein
LQTENSSEKEASSAYFYGIQQQFRASVPCSKLLSAAANGLLQWLVEHQMHQMLLLFLTERPSIDNPRRRPDDSGPGKTTHSSPHP